MDRNGSPNVPGAYSFISENEGADENRVIHNSTPPPMASGLLPPTPPSVKPVPNLQTPGETTKQVQTSALDGMRKSDLGSPVGHVSPPTPEHTPKNGDLLTPRAPGTFQDHPSVADSFNTANEQFSSGDNASREQLLLNSDAKSARMLSWLDTASHTSFDNAQARGSGTFWEEATPQLSDHSFEKPYMNGTGGDVVEREWDPNLMRNVTVRRKRPRVAGQAQTKEALRNSFNVSMAVARIESSLEAEKQQRGYTEQSRSTRGLEQISPSPKLLSSPIHDSEGQADFSPSPEMATAPRENSNRNRFSGGSGSSTVVEAVVVDNSPTVNRRLRHVSKNLDLRDQLSSRENADRQPIDSTGVPSRRLSHKKNMLPHSQWSNNLMTVAPTKKSPGNLRRRRDSIPPRPLTAPEESMRPPGLAAPRDEDNSDANGPAEAKGPRVVSDPLPLRGSSDLQTVIRTQNISPPLVSPEAKNFPESNQVDNTSPSIEANSPSILGHLSKLRHVRKFSNKSEDTGMEEPRTSLDQSADPQTSSVRSATGPEPELSSSLLGPSSAVRSGDRSSLGYLFSPTSLTSATPEAMEISEAKAVTLHSHNNNSLVVIQNQSNTAPRQQTFMLPPSPPRAQPPARGVLNIQPATPTMGQDQFEGNLDSPLRNPRAAPAPPVVVIPPTPARDLDLLEAQRQPPSNPLVPSNRLSSQQGIPKRAPSLLDRARRYSDTFISPLTKSTTAYSTTSNGRFSTFRRGFSLRKSNPRTLNISNPSQPYEQQEHTTKLHPLWRPRQFWDDASDSEFSDSEPYPYPNDSSNNPYDPDADRLPAGGDTSDVLPHPDSGPDQDNATHSGGAWKRMNSVKGFLIGNSLGLERGPTNKRRHVVSLPSGKRVKRGEEYEGTAVPWSQRTPSGRSEVRESARRSGAKHWNKQQRQSGARRWAGFFGFGSSS